jgi:hypothetical protein
MSVSVIASPGEKAETPNMGLSHDFRRGPNGLQHQSGRAPESVNHELIFRQISPLGAPATQSMTPSSHEKSGCTRMPNSNDVATNEQVWEHVLSLLVVSASALGGSAVLLMQALPPMLHGFP